MLRTPSCMQEMQVLYCKKYSALASVGSIARSRCVVCNDEIHFISDPHLLPENIVSSLCVPRTTQHRSLHIKRVQCIFHLIPSMLQYFCSACRLIRSSAPHLTISRVTGWCGTSGETCIRIEDQTRHINTQSG